MPRVRIGAARTQKRNRILRQARGFYGSRSTSFWRARLSVIQAGWYAYRDRRQRKRDMRAIWIVRLTAACRMRGARYSTFINGLKLAGIILNRKMLSEIAIQDPKTFDAILEKALAAARAQAKPAPKAAPAKA
jgi:large subunit ribosomal protein L20